MTVVRFFSQNSLISGFEMTGHSSVNSNDEAGKIVCAAVSSAAYMAANTITDIVGAAADISVSDAKMNLRLKDKFLESQITLEGLKCHLSQLSKEYKNNLKVTMEV